VAQRRFAVGRLPGADLRRARSRRERKRAAVDAAAEAAPGEIAQVAADRVLGCRKDFGEGGRQHPPVAVKLLKDLLLSFGGENRHECARSWGVWIHDHA
jgi:hypothetical protein